jgi:hypothetical protein
MLKLLPGRACCALLLLVWGIPVMLAACGGQPYGKPPAATSTTVSTVIIMPTSTPGKARIPYPWPMKQRQNPYSGQPEWLPDDTRVYQELETDFLAYWVWSGQAGPKSFPFSPDPGQIALLATPAFSAQLQAYLAHLQTSGQVTAYPGAQVPLQPQIQTCTQDGLQCQSYYSFGPATKIIYNIQTGQVVARTRGIQVIFQVNQSYNKELQRWQLSDLRSQELNG